MGVTEQTLPLRCVPLPVNEVLQLKVWSESRPDVFGIYCHMNGLTVPYVVQFNVRKIVWSLKTWRNSCMRYFVTERSCCKDCCVIENNASAKCNFILVSLDIMFSLSFIFIVHNCQINDSIRRVFVTNLWLVTSLLFMSSMLVQT